MLSSPERKGRPRDTRVDAAILAATTGLLAEVGYSALSLAAVAERASTTTAAIYRRWPSKAHLVHEAVFPSALAEELSFTDDLEQDVRVMVTGVVALFGSPEVRTAMPALLGEVVADPALHAVLLARFQGAVWQRLRERVVQAVAAGEVRGDVDADLIIEVVSGTTVMALTFRELDASWVDRLTSLVLKGIRT